MCGLVFTTRSVDGRAPEWRRAMDCIECRGPDAEGEHHSARYTAGHRRLEIIGLGPAGLQPYSADPEEDLLVYNGEIYNYRELGARLGLDVESDTQVLYEILRIDRTELLSELRGMFAFVYWRRNPEVIVAARDFFGVKPLFVTMDHDGVLSFASVVAALVPLTTDRSVDPVSIAGFLATGYFEAGSSAFSAVRKHPEGTVTTWRRAGGHWTSTEQPLSLADGPVLSTADAIDDSVRAHLVSDVPVGVLLSGGVDSTLLAASARQQVDELRTYSLVNPGSPEIDESPFARWNAAVIGSRHVEVAFDPASSVEVIRNLVRSSGEPFADAACIPLAILCARVADDLKVVLAGEGADELFGGYRRYDVQRWQEHPMTRTALRRVSRSLGSNTRYARRAPSQAVRTWAHWGEVDEYLSYSYLMSSEWQVVTATIPRAGAEALAARRASWARMNGHDRALGLPDHRAFDVTQWLPNVFLEKSDRASMLHGVEVRVPYLDPVVAHAAMTYPPPDSRKAPLRAALLQKYPDVRLPPRKMGLSVDTSRLMRSSGLQDYLTFVLHDRSSILRDMIADDSAGLARRADLNSALAFRLGVLGLWQHELVDVAR